MSAERRSLVACEFPLVRIELQEAVDRFRLHAGGLGHPFGRPSGWRAEKHRHPQTVENVDNAAHSGGFPGAGTAVEDDEPLRWIYARDGKARPALKQVNVGVRQRREKQIVYELRALAVFVERNG